ncbi:hypothetical protein ACA910_008771 [Epithemia clementina (nom. ined.)]
MISNNHVSSGFSPVVLDHPLANRPFSSFRTKLTTAKVLGFDPEDSFLVDRHDNMDTTTTTTTNAGQRLLKTGSGDLIFHEWTATLFSRETFTDPTIQRYRLQYPIAIILVALARPTNRTMVLPRHRALPRWPGIQSLPPW